MAIVFERVSFAYMGGTAMERRALQDVSFSAEPGTFTAIAGHTGSGKSTLVQHMNGLLHPDTGRVLVDDVDISAKTPESRAARRSVGMVFQYPEQQLFEETVARDIAFGPHNLGLSEAEVQERVKQAMRVMALDAGLSEQSPFALSGGQKRRVAIAGVLALAPKYLVLDEPTAGLDPASREQLMGTMLRLKKKGMGLVFVSHNMDDIARLADRVLILNQGRLVVDAPPREAFSDRETLKIAGLQPPQAMQFEQMLEARGVPVRTDSLTLEETLQAVKRAFHGKGEHHAQ
ncbi:MAG: energy-coupling factor transporter ATPase [Selenomonadaceae bacterium]|nr:energy-coupling factor transporter ATPase [Selenomonadaceae bacterium]